MNSHTFNDLMNITRKNVSDSWSAETFSDVGFQRGRFQPTGGAMGTTQGGVNPNASATFFCPSDSYIETGDILYDKYSRGWVVVYTQLTGVSGSHDHMEAGLIQHNG